MLNLAVLLEEGAREVPTRTAIIFNDMKLPYAAVNAAANQVANGLVGLGIQPGDKVALTCPNLPYFPIIYYGILKAGAVVVPLNVLLKGREIAYHLADSDAKAYFCFQGTPDLPMGQFGHEGFEQTPSCEHFFMITIDPAGASPIEGTRTLGQLMYRQPPTFDTVMTHADDTAVILYTSGTTGQPKGAELSHSNMLLNARLSDSMYEAQPDDVHLVTLPLFHSFGQSVQMNTGFYNKSALTLLPRFDADAALSIMQRDKVTIFAGVPTMYWAMLNHPNPEKFDIAGIAANLRLAVSGGSAMPVEVMRAFGEKFGVQILEGYGLSETSPVATFNRLDRPAKPGSIGLPVWGVQVRLVDPLDQDVPQGEMGEILLKGHIVMKGYYKKPEATAEAMRGGWFHTGDLARMDEEGYIYITDRVKDMIIRGGFNVYPREIEEVMITHPAVSLAAVVGVPHESHGEEVKAYVILKPGQTVDEAELIDWCRGCMASYKYPRLIEIRESLPMTATGKILKRELK
ncbi:Long-chain-fatty-acid--CoA ligase [Candidatus Promineifilum breve]|uniref:Long-chain-fatty-acid--CoA ligase n=1 Tax=Candidatus Promineifilum breve TaxID=1806508 RepID=A0A160T4U2_9CHLR|nr:long-chain fatty acid--CoA ligase [Candidatus Promineifilum breve]CUS04812.2 Long-chain-fatty-acid--CoA ligase [Candidatus Promineifilum breve]